MLRKNQASRLLLLFKEVEESCCLLAVVSSYKLVQPLSGNVDRSIIQEYVSQAAAANYNQGNTGYRAPISNQIRPPGFPPNHNVQNQGNNQNRYNQNRGNFNQAPAYQSSVNQGQVYQPQVVQPPAYQAPAYQAPAPQTHGVSKTDFDSYVKANDAVMRNMQNQNQVLQTQGQNMQTHELTCINLMPYFVWKNLSLPELTPTCMTLKLADRSISEPIGIAEDVYVTVGKFQFPADFVVVDFEPDPRVPLILGRSFLKTSRALIDVYEGEITLRVGREAITFYLGTNFEIHG
ncbi:reverse transcriptase domain-containing protein [Tanacetum coccineum]|uniref:Reverse transcriptase domain-containing protein n=1 Tax=Tanacetum coccineum TaxID=301880 RepID=A0ABQ5C712_9ASTR